MSPITVPAPDVVGLLCLVQHIVHGEEEDDDDDEERPKGEICITDFEDLKSYKDIPIFKKKTVNTVLKNRYGHNFQNIASKTNQRWVINYDKPLIHFGTDIFENCGRICFFEHLIILPTDLILLQSPNFGRPKQGQTVSFGQPNSV